MISTSLPRLEDGRFIRGTGQYTDDVNIPGQAYSAFLRSAHAHAVIRSIDIGTALKSPGVLAVLTGKDYLSAGFRGVDHRPNPIQPVKYEQLTFGSSQTGSIFSQPHFPLAIDKARHTGDAIAMVIASTAAQARDAIELIRVDYEPLESVIRAEDAMRDGAPQLWESASNNLCFRVQFGDRQAVKKQFESAFHVVRRTFRHSRVVSSHMEPRAAIGSYDNGFYTLISGSQGVVRQQAILAAALGVPTAKVRVICPDVGGGFGTRTYLYPEQVAVVWAARHIGRAVKWTGDRSESFVSDFQGRDAVAHAAMALSQDGHIVAIDYDWIGNVGAHAVSYVPMGNVPWMMTSVYHAPLAAVQVSAVLTNTAPVVPYRGAGRPEAIHVIERLLDIAADELRVDRVELRRRNLITRSMMPYTNALGLTYDSGDFHGNMRRVLELADWKGFNKRRKAALVKGRLCGIGLANYIESPVGAPQERVTVTIRSSGMVDIVAGTQSTGQGHETTFAQVVAAQLGVPIDVIQLKYGDTEFVTAGGGTHSARSMRIAGSLLFQASQQIIENGRSLVAKLSQTGVERIHYANGTYVSHDSKRRMSIFEVAKLSESNGLVHDKNQKLLSATVDFTGRLPAFPTGAVVCEVEIDPDTGEVAITNYASVDDVGTPINPMIVHGQIHGGVAQGIGQALVESYFTDLQSGQVLSGSYMDYGLLRAGDMPPMHLELTTDRTAGNPLGIKGCGESGTTPATAVIFNALADALREISNDELDMPATPSVVWHYLNRARSSADKTAVTVNPKELP